MRGPGLGAEPRRRRARGRVQLSGGQGGQWVIKITPDYTGRWLRDSVNTLRRNEYILENGKLYRL